MKKRILSKKLIKYLFLFKLIKYSVLLILFLIGYSSCSLFEKENGLPPVITFDTQETIKVIDYSVEGDNIINLNVTVSAEEKIRFFNLTRKKNQNDLFQYDIIDISQDFKEKTSYNFNFIDTITKEEFFNATSIDYIFSVTDFIDRKFDKTFSVSKMPESNNETPLSSDSSFTWQRIDSSLANGLERFGLEWTSNIGDSVVISALASNKLVMLSLTEWTSINTQEALKVAVDEIDAVDNYIGISAIDSTQNINNVIASKVEDVYFILKIENATVIENDGQTTISINGKFKR